MSCFAMDSPDVGKCPKRTSRDLAPSGRKRKCRSTSPEKNAKKSQLREGIESKNDVEQRFVINVKPDQDNLLLESSYKTPVYTSIFLDHRIKEKSTATKDWRYFSKKNKATLLQDVKSGERGVADDMMEEVGVEEKVKHFSEELSKFPTNVDLWIRFINFQEEKLRRDLKVKEIKNPTDKRILNEIKMSVIEQALKKNPRNLPISLIRLEVGEMLWERERVEKCWKDLMSRGRLEVSFWRKYINFITKKFEGFTVKRMMSVYRECFRFLRARLEEDLTVLEDLMGFLWEVIEFLDGAGYSEMCIAIFQLMFELNLNVPLNVDRLPFPDKLDFLSAYWSGFQQKFGEDGWVGWRDWVERKGHSVAFEKPLSLKGDDEDAEFKIIAENFVSREETWLSVERYRSDHHWCSWRPEREDDDDGEGCEDEERIVLFDDISGFLFLVADDDHKFEVVWKFLDYLVTRSRHFCLGNEAVEHGGPYSSFKQVFKEPGEFKCIEENFEEAGKMIANVFEVAIKVFRDDYRRLLTHRYVEYFVHKESRQKELRKFFKDVLRDNGEDVILWTKYARFESWCGKKDVVEKVINTTLSVISKSTLDKKRISRELLVRRFQFDFEVSFDCSILCEGCSVVNKNNRNENSKAFKSVDHLIGKLRWLEESPLNGPGGVLKIKKILEGKLEDALIRFHSSGASSGPNVVRLLRFFSHDIIHRAHLSSLFNFLVTSSINDSISVYSDTINRLSVVFKEHPQLEKEGKILQQLLSGDRQKLLGYCKQQIFVPRTTLVTVASDDVKNHPKNVVMVENFYELNNASPLQTRNDIARLIFGENDLLCLKMHYIRSLIRRLLKFSETGLQTESTANQLRNFFEHCLRVNTSCLLWRLYLYFHNLAKDDKSARKFFRAIEGMPGSKVLYLQSAIYNPDMLVKIHRTMDSKEIRLRTFLEEVNLLISSYKVLHVTP